MRIPIVVVHGIGKNPADPDSYYSSWGSYFPNAHFFNAAWHEFGFNTAMHHKAGTVTDPFGFSELSSKPLSTVHKVPLMERIFHYSNAKIKALDNYLSETPFWCRRFIALIDRIIFGLLGVQSVDFIGDIFTYLNWEEYSNASYNPILEKVASTIQKAIKFYPGIPVHIVCHSLGTKIVWDALNKLDLPEGSIGILMTMSSPLQPMKIFGWYRRGDNTNFHKPTCVDYWINAYDIRDLIGAPIGGASFKLTDSLYLTMAEVLAKPFLYPCINVCTPIGLFPWSAHTKAWKSKNTKSIFSKYLKKYDSSSIIFNPIDFS